MGNTEWTEQEQAAMEWALRKTSMAFCTRCSVKLEHRRSGDGAEPRWILKCPRCNREFSVPIRRGNASA